MMRNWNDGRGLADAYNNGSGLDRIAVAAQLCATSEDIALRAHAGVVGMKPTGVEVSTTGLISRLTSVVGLSTASAVVRAAAVVLSPTTARELRGLSAGPKSDN